MSRLHLVALVLLLCVATTLRAQTIDQKVYTWLKNQQDANTTGLLGNQESDNLAGLYPNALAALCFMKQGDVARAERVLDFYLREYPTAFAAGSVGGFHQFAHASTGAIDRTSDRWIGDNAWLLIAGNHYRVRTGRTKYDQMRGTLAAWLINLQEPNGGIKAGYTGSGSLMTVLSTEGNLDCYSALVWNGEPRNRIKTWLDTYMWVAADRRFKQGSTVNDSALDTCSWAITALGPSYSTTLPYTETHFAYTARSDANGLNITGFRDLLGQNRVWLEGTGEMALAYRVVANTTKANTYIAQLERAMTTSQRWPTTVGVPNLTNNPGWTGATTRIWVPSQAWYLFAKWNWNPMAAP